MVVTVPGSPSAPVAFLHAHLAAGQSIHQEEDSRYASRPGREARRAIGANVGARDGRRPLRAVLGLPVPEELVEPGVVHPEERVAGARHAVAHLPFHFSSASHMAKTNSTLTKPMLHVLQHPRDKLT